MNKKGYEVGDATIWFLVFDNIRLITDMLNFDLLSYSISNAKNVLYAYKIVKNNHDSCQALCPFCVCVSKSSKIYTDWH